MSRQRAPTKATGGGGYTFADKVAGAFLAQMLKRAFPFEPEFGAIAELHFETRDSEHILDDLLLILKHGSDTSRCAISVKSNKQLTTEGFNKEFVADLWAQWKSASFNSDSDLLCLVAGVIDEPTLHHWRELQKQAADTTPERFVNRMANGPDGPQSSGVQRAIFASITKGVDGATELNAARLASSVRVVSFSDDREAAYRALCSEIVRDGSQDEGAKLWSRLLELAAASRPTGGYFDQLKLVRKLRPDFDLRDFPDFEADWNRVESVAMENAKAVRRVIGNGIQLPRVVEMAAVATAVEDHTVIVIAGESGSGKSAAVVQLGAPGGRFK